MNDMERVTFMTEDGVEIVGLHSPGRSGKAALFLHMMPATKESWAPLMARLVEIGFEVLAIDMRGHGESVRGPEGRTLAYETFSDAEHQAKRSDVNAAVEWLVSNGATRERLAIVGASIGANLAIDHAAAHPEIPATAALSPGLAYRGIETVSAAARMPREQKLLVVASDEDAHSHASMQAIAAAKEDAETHGFTGAGHGTAMLSQAPGLLEFLASWIDLNVR